MLGIRTGVWALAGTLLLGALAIQMLSDAPEPSVAASAATRSVGGTSLPASLAVQSEPPAPLLEPIPPEEKPTPVRGRAEPMLAGVGGSDRAADPELERPDPRLVILEEEAARASLRRGLVPERSERGATNSSNDSSDAERRALSDELVIDHLVAETYRTTVFAYDANAVGESRSDALALLRRLDPEERRALLEEALADDGERPAPVFESEYRQRVEPGS